MRPRAGMSSLDACELSNLMAIKTVEASLDLDFEDLVTKFRDKLDTKTFYEFSSVIQALRQWKDLFHATIRPVNKAGLHSNLTIRQT
jgi:hypothetical protein